MSSLRPPLRLAFAVLAAVFLASALYTFTRTPRYDAIATLYFADFVPTRTEVATSGVKPDIQCGPDSQTLVKVIESRVILEQVALDLPHPLRLKIVPGAASQEALRAALHERLSVSSELRGNGLLVFVAYRHPIPAVAAEIANAFALAAQEHYNRIRREGTAQALRDLEIRLAQARSEADSAETALRQPDLNEATRQELEADARKTRLLADQIEQRLAQAGRDFASHTDPFTFTPATPPADDDYASPDHLLDLSLGLLAGLASVAVITRLLRYSSPAGR